MLRNSKLAIPNSQLTTRIYKLSEKRDAVLQRIDRGGRVASIREALDMTGEAFAKELSARMKAMGVPKRYDKGKVSLIESGTRKLTVEEAVIIADLDPRARGAVWLVFGERRRGALRPEPGTTGRGGGERKTG